MEWWVIGLILVAFAVCFFGMRRCAGVCGGMCGHRSGSAGTSECRVAES